MSRRGNCYDNAPMEQLFRSLKTEWVPALGCMTKALAEQDIGRYLMQRYNWTRPHQHNSFVPPALRKKNSILCPGIVDRYSLARIGARRDGIARQAPHDSLETPKACLGSCNGHTA